MQFVVRKFWDFKLQIHMIEKKNAQLTDVIGHLEGIITRSLFIYVCTFVYKMMSRLIARGITRSYSMRQRRIGIVSNCDVCGGLIFNAQRYKHMNDAYFAPSTHLPYGWKKIFDCISHELQYLDREHSHHFTLDLNQLDRIFEYRFIRSSSYSFPVTNVELEYMFYTLGFLWLHHDSPPYLLYLLEKLIDGLSDDRMRPSRSTTTTTSFTTTATTTTL